MSSTKDSRCSNVILFLSPLTMQERSLTIQKLLSVDTKISLDFPVVRIFHVNGQAIGVTEMNVK